MECELSHPTVCIRQKQPGFTILGSFAEYVIIQRADQNVMVIPLGVSFVEAAALGCRFTTAFWAVVQQGLQLNLLKREKEREHGYAMNHPSVAQNSQGKTLVVGSLGLSCIVIAKEF